jgi:hypothetical protein
MAQQKAFMRSKKAADRKISAQGQENAELRRKVAAMEQERNAPSTVGGGNSNDVSYDLDDPEDQRWSEQQKINREMMRQMGIIVDSQKHLVSQKVSSERSSQAEDVHRDEVIARYGKIDPEIEKFLVEARMTGNYAKVLDADAAVMAYLRDGAADLSTQEAAGQLGVGGSSGMGSVSRSTGGAPLDLSLSDDDLASIAKRFPNDRAGQAEASMAVKLDRMLAGETV